MPEPSQKIEDTVFIAFDTETTGLFPIAGKLVELGAVKFRYGGKILDTFSVLIDPQSPIPLDVVRIHGITDEMVQGKPTLKEIIPKFIHFLGESENVLLGHNASFDIGFVGVDIVRAGFEHPPHIILDTLDLSRRRLPYLPNYKLETVAKALGISLGGYHRALSDSMVVKSIFEQLIERNPRIHTLKELSKATQTFTFADSEAFKVEPPPGFEDLALAIEGALPITMIYEGGTKGFKPRDITPLGLMQRNGIVYLSAFCHVDKIEKSFRMDRIRGFKIHKE